MEFGFSQNPYYIPIDKSSGLPSNSIYDIFQDSKGFMWFASGKGLCRYDGNLTKTFTADFQTSKSGSCIQEDKYGRIWYENFDGFLYYVQNDKINALKQHKPLSYFRYAITNKYVIILEADGVQFYHLKTLQPYKKIYKKFNYLKFVYNKDNTVYIFDDKLHVVDASENLKTYSFPENFQKDFDVPIVQKTEKGIVIISKFNNKYCYFENGKFETNQFNFKVNFIQNLAVTKNYLWLCTTKGIIQFNTKNREAKTYFAGNNISFLYLDKHNNYWVSTINEGVFFIQNFNTKVIELPSKPTVLTKSKSNVLMGVESDAVYTVNPIDYTFKAIYSGNLNHGVNQLTHDEKTGNNYLTSSSFKVVTSNNVQELGVGAVKSVSKIDGKYFSYAASGVSGVFTNDKVLKSKWDTIFAKYRNASPNSSFSKIILVPNSNGKSTTFNPLNQTIYFATNNGLIAFSQKEQKEIKFNNETIYFTKIDQYKGTVYGISSSEKVYTIDKNNVIKPYKIPFNFIKDKIEKIALHEQYLFLFTADAVFEINLDKTMIRKILDITKDMIISDIEIFDNKYYFASSKGIIVKSGIRNAVLTAPKLFVNTVIVNDEKSISQNKTILGYKENNIKINFTVLSNVPNEKYPVLFSINNSKWASLDAENRNLILSSLSPNHYEIKLKINAKNSTKIETVQFTIKRPLWLNPIALFAIGAIGFLLLFVLYKWQISKIKKKNQFALDKINLEKNVNQSKLKAIKSQMNPHFFYNALNTLQSYILSNEKKQAVEYLSKFSNLTRTILEMTEKDFISVSDEIKTLKLYLDIEKARFEEDFNYEIKTNSELDDDAIKIPTMLLQPYIENAIKHGLLHKQGKKDLRIIFEFSADILKISIDDNGIGRDKSRVLNAIKNKNHVSFATEATQNRIELLNQYTHRTISVQIIDKHNAAEQSLGTTVLFEIPISY